MFVIVSVAVARLCHLETAVDVKTTSVQLPHPNTMYTITIWLPSWEMGPTKEHVNAA